MIDGGASKRKTTTHAPPPVDGFDPPADLTAAERAIWVRQAPHALKNGTLTAAMLMAFENLCRNAAIEREVALSADRGTSRHKGLMQQVSADFLAFNLKPSGKRVQEPGEGQPAVPANPLARFLKRQAQ